MHLFQGMWAVVKRLTLEAIPWTSDLGNPNLWVFLAELQLTQHDSTTGLDLRVKRENVKDPISQTVLLSLFWFQLNHAVLKCGFFSSLPDKKNQNHSKWDIELTEYA